MKTRLIIASLAALAVVIPGLVIGLVASRVTEEAVVRGIEARLMDQARAWRVIADSYEKNIRAQEESARAEAQEIVIAQAKISYELVDKALTDNGGALPAAQEEDLFTRLGRHTVGRTGYVWVLDYSGRYVLSRDRARDGENIWDSTYDSGTTYPVRELVSIGRDLQPSEVGFLEYLWANPGDPEPRYKISAVMHFPQMEWVLGVSAYYDDVVDTEYRRKTIEDLKDLIAAQGVGRTGYIAVVDGKGRYVVSQRRARDGEDISQSKDASGRLFIQESIARALAAGTDADVIRYPWQNPGEAAAREKIAALVYYEPWDWVIWPSSYLDEFTYTSDLMRWVVLAVVLGALASGFTGYELARRAQERK